MAYTTVTTPNTQIKRKSDGKVFTFQEGSSYDTSLYDVVSAPTTTGQQALTNVGVSAPLGSTEATNALLAKGSAMIGQTVIPTSSVSNTKDLTTGSGATFVPPASTSQGINETYTQSMLDTLEKQRKSLEDMYTKQLADTQKKLDESQKKYDDYIATQKDILETDVKPLTEPFRADIETSERQRLQIEQNYQENQNLVNELDGLLTQIQNDLLAEKNVTGLSSIRTPRIATASEEATARVGVIEAVMAARNNQITVAENLIDRTVTAMTADRNDQLTYYNSLLSFYDSQADTEGNKIIQLTKDEKDTINSQVKLLEDDLASTQANVDYIKNLMLDPNTAVIVAQSGVTLNDTPQEVQTKFAQYYYTQEVTQSKNEMETNGYEYMTEAQAMTKPTGEITTITDSKGVQRYWWKKAEKTPGEIENEEYQIGLQFVQDNPNATQEELEQSLRANTNLSDADITSLIKGAKTESKLTRENISLLYDIQDNDEKTGWFETGKTNKEKLDEIMDTIKKYQAIGYSDDEILKLIKE